MKPETGSPGCPSRVGALLETLRSRITTAPTILGLEFKQHFLSLEEGDKFTPRTVATEGGAGWPWGKESHHQKCQRTARRTLSLQLLGTQVCELCSESQKCFFKTESKNSRGLGLRCSEQILLAPDFILIPCWWSGACPDLCIPARVRHVVLLQGDSCCPRRGLRPVLPWE